MKLHNTLSRSTETFTPQADNAIKLYTCGPTVYSNLQIGNWTAYVRWDVLVRTLRASGYDVNWVMNITDVGHLVSDGDDGEDKMEKGARREGKTAWEVAATYTQDFVDGMAALNITMPTHLVKATDHIPEQIALVKALETKGFTYVIDDGVYFDTSKFPSYGDLARLKLDDLRAGARVDYNQQKRNASDFALWKFTPKGTTRDMEWESPWGKGFPGWHIECSAMAMKYLGDTLDIHCGGIDHIPVHHTNEIAQSEAASGKQFSRFWVHSNFLMVDGTKLSKSLGNSYTLADLAAKGFTAMDFRMFVLHSQYRTEANFTWDVLEAAHNRLQRWRNIAVLRYQLADSDKKNTEDNVTGAGAEKQSDKEQETQRQIILEKLQDDLNTPEALATIDQVLSTYENGLTESQLPKFEELLQVIDELLGLDLYQQSDITEEQKQLIQRRTQARTGKDWAASDRLRAELAEQGITVRDTSNRQIWSLGSNNS